MKKNIISLVLVIIYITSIYAFEMSDLSVADFSLFHEPTGKFFSFYDSPERFFDIMGEERELKKDEIIDNEFYYMWYIRETKRFAKIYEKGDISHIKLQIDNFIINHLKLYRDFKTIRGIKIGSSLEEILNNYNNCYIGNLDKNNWGIWDESLKLYKNDMILKDAGKINTVYLICEFRDYDRLLDIDFNDGIYYVVEFKLNKEKKVSSIGFYIVPYLPWRIQVNRNKILITKDVKDLGRKRQQKSAKEENLGV